MKVKIFLILSLTIFVSAGVSAQEKQDKIEKNKKKSQPPPLAIAEIQQPPPTPAPVVEARPANGSLFSDTAINGNLLNDFKARRVGDLVFVEVVENSTATVTSGANRKRDSGTLGGIGTAAGALPVPGAAIAGTIVGALGTRKYDGKGSTERNSDVRARIAARVVEVLPNGDLRIEALKLVKINKETEQLAVTGIVRPTDLTKDNAIETFSVGDLRVEFNGKGVASADNAPGWLFRLFEKITPF